MKTLTLTIAEPWFSMIRDGKKKEEYREIIKEKKNEQRL